MVDARVGAVGVALVLTDVADPTGAEVAPEHEVRHDEDGGAQEAEVDRDADALRVLGAASLGAGAERPLGQGQVGFVDLDGSDDDGDRVRVGVEGAGGTLSGIPERRRWALEDGR